MGAKRDEIVKFLDATLDIANIPDTSRNGLQVAGCEAISKVGLAVDACIDTYKKAVENGCQMLITHHGLVWDGIKYVTGRNYNHIKYLIVNDLNLYAVHLPLDMHGELGNNIALARLLSLKSILPFGEYKGAVIGFMGDMARPQKASDIAAIMRKKLGGPATILPFGKRLNKKIGIVSGGGAFALSEAIAKGLDCYITGEGDYSNYHAAKEAGINVIYLGHYYTEQLGVEAIGMLLKKKFGIGAIYIDLRPLV